MKYQIKGGTIYTEKEHRPLACLKNELFTEEKGIYSPAGKLRLRAKALTMENSGDRSVHCRKYVLLDENNREIMQAQPEYAENEDPAVNGWPLSHMPKVDHANLTCQGNLYCLTMKTSENYIMTSSTGAPVVTISHLGYTGGWSITAPEKIRPELLCGLFAFCRFIEGENEFTIV